MHSQAVRQPPLDLWILTEERKGPVLTANCTCRAGQGSTCSHVAAVLYYVEAAVNIRNKPTVTEERAYWLLPRPTKEVRYARIADIDFTSAQTKRQRLDAAINDLHNTCAPPPKPRPVRKVPAPTKEEQINFLATLKSLGSRAAALTVWDQFHDDFCPKVTQPQFPAPLSALAKRLCDHGPPGTTTILQNS